MGIDLRFPNITAKDDGQKLQQMQSYMYQLVEQLNWALSNVEQSSKGGYNPNVVKTGGFNSMTEAQAQDTFNSIKSLIIKSSDIIQAYGTTIKHQLDGYYVAQSDFGTYTEEKLAELNMTPDDLAQIYYNKQIIDGMFEGVKESQAWIRSGLLDDSGDVPVYGVEVGQKTERDGQEVFNKYARFTAEGIYFYLPGASDAIAWMSGTKLYITNAEINGSLKLGKYMIDIGDGIAFKWIGG